MKLINLITTTALLTFSLVSHASVSKNDINCGIGDYSKNKILRVTTQIPYITSQDNPDFFFGCTIKSINETFTVHMVITAPDPNPKTIKTNLAYTKNNIDNKLVIKTNPVTFTGFAQASLTLDKSDNPGEYIVEIFKNNMFIRKVTFNVIK